MPSPAGATYKDATGQYVAWDDNDQDFLPAVSTPDLSTFVIPVDYKLELEAAAPGVTTAIAQAQKPGESWPDALVRILPNLSMGLQQLQLMWINVGRARKGEPPLDARAYSGAYVNVGLDPGTQRLVTYAGLGILALFVLNMATKK
jgi:hypothetical protein